MDRPARRRRPRRTRTPAVIVEEEDYTVAVDVVGSDSDQAWVHRPMLHPCIVRLWEGLALKGAQAHVACCGVFPRRHSGACVCSSDWLVPSLGVELQPA